MSNFSFGALGQIALVGSAALSPLFSSPQNASVRTVDLGYAKYQTDVSLAEGVTSFLAVRYAAAPTGDRRFHAPQAPPAVEELQMATAHPPACWPMDTFFANGKLDFSEDCLMVNVHVPTSVDASQQNENGLLPVLAYIHGGGYKHGAADWYPAERLVRDSGHSLIAVNIQYRLGVFGFLGGQGAKDNGALNAGLLDQELALAWIQKHIRAFGGDPNKVSLFGHSAGAGSVIQHLIAHGGQASPRLFHAALLSSPFLPPQYAYDDPLVEGAYRALAERAKCPVNDGTLACLRALDPAALRDAGVLPTGMPLFPDFGPVVDGSFIRERPTAALAKKAVNAETLLVFANTNEAAIFMSKAEVRADAAAYIAALLPRLPEADVARAARLYPSSAGAADMFATATQIKSELALVCPSYWVLDAFSGKKAWKGLFAIPPGIHGLDLNYIFKDAGIYNQPVSFPDDSFRRALQHAYFGVTTHGAPGALTPLWPAYAYGGARTEMLFNQTEDGAPDVRAFQTDAGLRARCAFWHGVAEYTAQ